VTKVSPGTERAEKRLCRRGAGLEKAAPRGDHGHPQGQRHSRVNRAFSRASTGMFSNLCCVITRSRADGLEAAHAPVRPGGGRVSQVRDRMSEAIDQSSGKPGFGEVETFVDREPRAS